MLQPKKYKWRKQQRGVVRGFSKGGTDVSFGEFGMMAMSSGYITSRQIEAARISISRELKREGSLWIRIFPHKPITKRPAETRMGKGKGDVDHYVAIAQPGRIMFEIGGVTAAKATSALRKASYKLAVKTKVVTRKLV